MMQFKGLDHIAIVVADTDAALTFYRDQLGFKLIASEIVNEPPVRLTHLDMGNTQMQLVQPVSVDHPLTAWLEEHGEGLHHICLKVWDVLAAMAWLPENGLAPRGATPHAGIQGRKAIFIDPTTTRGVQFEITSEE